jgi:hypothetical protein
MNSDMLFIIGIAVTVLVLVIIETHIAFMIFALCAGYVLTHFAASELYEFLAQWISPSEFPLIEIVDLTLLFIPSILIAHRFRRTQRGVGRFFQQLLPALAFTLMAGVLVIDVLPKDTVANLQADAYLAGMFESYPLMLIIFAIGTAMFDILIKHANEPLSHKKRGPGRPPKHQ